MQPPNSPLKPTSDAPFASLRAGGADCPSDLMLDRLHSEEIQGKPKAELEAHLAVCTSCAQRLDVRRAGFSAFADIDERPLLAGVRRKLAESESESESQTRRGFSWAKLLALVTSATAVSAVAAVVLMTSKPTTLPAPDGVREKGSAALHVYRKVGERAVEALSGDSFAPGDTLRFVVDLPAPSRVSVLGVEASGALYVAWPQDDKAAVAREAGKAQALEGAVVLDEKLGRETLYLVTCPRDGENPATHCKVTAKDQSLACPSACQASPFVLHKK